MSVNPIDLLCDELNRYGLTLLDLIERNKLMALEHSDDQYYQGKVDAYELAYTHFMDKIKKVNSFTPRTKG
jgi:hypothetical protein